MEEEEKKTKERSGRPPVVSVYQGEGGRRMGNPQPVKFK